MKNVRNYAISTNDIVIVKTFLALYVCAWLLIELNSKRKLLRNFIIIVDEC